MATLFAPANFRFVRGTGWDDDVFLSDQSTGLPVNLTGIERILMRVRASANGPVLSELSTDSGTLVVVDAAGGQIGIRCNSTFTNTFPAASNRWASYIYDAVIEASPNEYQPAVTGRIIVEPTITQPHDT